MFKKQKTLKKELTLFDIYAITMSAITAGIFLLPGLAYAQVGSDLALAYLFAAIPVIPGVFSIVELATAMPRSGGIYYFLDRSLGSLVGIIGGFGFYVVVVLKSVIALLGAGAYLHVFFPDASLTIVGLVFAVVFTVINLAGTKKSSSLQSILVVIILGILMFFFSISIFHINPDMMKDFLELEYTSFISTSGMLVVGYVGFAKIASVAEEIQQPEKNFPRGVFAALISTILIYTGVGLILPMIISGPDLAQSLTPLSDGATKILGKPGGIIIGIAALLAFSSVANVSIMTSSRYPMVMSRDGLIPPIFLKLNKNDAPVTAILFTFIIIIFFLVGFKPISIAKLAGSFQLLIFALVNLAVIVMRESNIPSYDPGYKSPLYPYMQIAGILLPIWFIHEMGIFSVLFTLSIIAFSAIWYFYYARKRVVRRGAIYHYMALLGEKKYDPLEMELRGILREKGLRKEDPYDPMISRGHVIDHLNAGSFEEIVVEVANFLASFLHISKSEIVDKYIHGTRSGATAVSNGAALPHIHIPGIQEPEIVLVRIRNGIVIEPAIEFWGKEIGMKPVYAIFFLVGSEDNPKRHLRILAQIAERIERDSFLPDWLKATEPSELRRILLRRDNVLFIHLTTESAYSHLIGKTVMEIQFPHDVLLAMIERNLSVVIPKGDTALMKDDNLTIIGDPTSLLKFQKQFRRRER